MLTTTEVRAFMNALDPGDVLTFSGTDPMDRLAQFVDGTSCNHVGIWIGDLADDGSGVIERFQTIHAGLSTRSLRPADRADLLGPGGPVRRNGAVWLIPLDELLAVRPFDLPDGSEIGGGLQYDEVTALRLRRADDIDTRGLLASALGYLDQDPAPVLDVGQMVDLARFWIQRAYTMDSPTDSMPALAQELFEAMQPILEREQASIERRRAEAHGAADAEVTTSARFVYDAFARAGHHIAVPLRKGIAELAPGGPEATREWITAKDIHLSDSFRAIARFTRPPTPRG